MKKTVEKMKNTAWDIGLKMKNNFYNVNNKKGSEVKA